MTIDDLTLDLDQQIDINAPIEDVYKAVLYRVGKGSTDREGQSMQMELEEWAGGRWFRDRGEGIQHLWGHVQTLKPPVLIELTGPMFMSYPAVNHVEWKLEETDGGTRLNLRHRAVGMISPEHREGVVTGWAIILGNIKKDATEAAASAA